MHTACFISLQHGFYPPLIYQQNRFSEYRSDSEMMRNNLQKCLRESPTPSHQMFYRGSNGKVILHSDQQRAQPINAQHHGWPIDHVACGLCTNVPMS